MNEYESTTSPDISCSVPQKNLEQLRELGLWFTQPIRCYGDGVRIYKPIKAGGNNIPDHPYLGANARISNHDGDDDSEVIKAEFPPQDTDAPCLVLFPQSDKWIVYGVDGSGGMLVGDFITEWDTIEEAIADIKDFYFGNPERMNLKAAFYRSRK